MLLLCHGIEKLPVAIARMVETLDGQETFDDACANLCDEDRAWLSSFGGQFPNVISVT